MNFTTYCSSLQGNDSADSGTKENVPEHSWDSAKGDDLVG